MKQHPQVIIADDHPISRLGMRVILAGSGNIEVVAEAASATELFDLLEEVPCDVVVSDYAMPEPGDADRANGLAMIRCFTRLYPCIPLVIVTALHSRELLELALRAGASGWVEKGDEPSAMVEAVHQAFAGHIYVSPSARRAAIDGGG
jgi:two-component system capsular synthesis response regulator RcsB